jgi:chemotaxis protein methyltransferase CheR
MRPAHESLRLSEREFLILRDLICERTGILYDDGKRELLADRLSRRAVELGFEAFIDYYYLLKYGPGSDEEWGRVLDALSVPETYFWREFDQIRVLVELLVPAHFAKPDAKPFRIWSAACAHGEEPLSIAIALREAGWLGRAPIEIVASDGSAQAIARARAGIYRERSFRSLSPALRQKYFTAEGNEWRISRELQSCIRWETVNLASPAETSRCLPADVIFCRNVFIYFRADAVRSTVRRFAEGLRRPGYLFVGVSESLLRITDDFELQERGGAYVYVPR